MKCHRAKVFASHCHDIRDVWQSGITLTLPLVENFARDEIAGPLRILTRHHTVALTPSRSGRGARTGCRTYIDRFQPSYTNFDVCSLDGLPREHGRPAAGEQPANRGRQERQAHEDCQQIRHGHVRKG